jgi:uncharacterized protein
MPEDLMRYDQLAQDALRGVVREALRRVAQSGLPGGHHFYIEFETPFAGVEMTDRMREKYPREMTVVLQHQYDGLIVHDDRFEVVLSFDNIREKLVVPFNSIKNFFDPAVPFGMRFEVVQARPALETPRLPSKLPTTKQAKKREETAAQSMPEATGAENIVSLDMFRKK